MHIADYNGDRIIVSVFVDDLIDERMYVMRDDAEALIVDPHVSEAMLEVLTGVSRVTVILTHEHYDHISGVNWLREHFDCSVYASDFCMSIISSPKNGTTFFPLLFIADREKYAYVKKTLNLPYMCNADYSVADTQIMEFSNHKVLMWKTPGHTPGGLSILIDDKYLFSGDNLLGNGMELNSRGSNEEDFRNTIDEYSRLDGDTVVFPGHGEIDRLESYLSKVRDYYKWN